MILAAIAAAVGFAAGIVGGLAGFGVGSILTTFLAFHLGTRAAVAAVTIPHLAATAVRFWTLRGSLDRHVLFTFGLTSAAGGLAGALLHAVAGSRFLTITLALLLILTGVTSAMGIVIPFGRRGSWIAGAVSGLLGGMVGSQGPIRAGAMLHFRLTKEAFVATSTAIALLVDLVRLPVYLATEWATFMTHAPLIAVVTLAAVAGTFAGRAILGRIPEATFRRGLAAVLTVLGGVLLASK